MVDQAQAVPDSIVVINLRVPADAEIWFNGDKTVQTGALRHFSSPPLSADKDGTYDIRCRWNDNGRQMERTRHLTVRAGDRLTLRFPE